jgi:hypothetical protein
MSGSEGQASFADVLDCAGFVGAQAALLTGKEASLSVQVNFVLGDMAGRREHGDDFLNG